MEASTVDRRFEGKMSTHMRGNSPRPWVCQVVAVCEAEARKIAVCEGDDGCVAVDVASEGTVCEVCGMLSLCEHSATITEGHPAIVCLDPAERALATMGAKELRALATNAMAVSAAFSTAFCALLVKLVGRKPSHSAADFIFRGINTEQRAFFDDMNAVDRYKSMDIRVADLVHRAIPLELFGAHYGKPSHSCRILGDDYRSLWVGSCVWTSAVVQEGAHADHRLRLGACQVGVPPASVNTVVIVLAGPPVRPEKESGCSGRAPAALDLEDDGGVEESKQNEPPGVVAARAEAQRAERQAARTAQQDKYTLQGVACWACGTKWLLCPHALAAVQQRLLQEKDQLALDEALRRAGGRKRRRSDRGAQGSAVLCLGSEESRSERPLCVYYPALCSKEAYAMSKMAPVSHLSLPKVTDWLTGRGSNLEAVRFAFLAAVVQCYNIEAVVRYFGDTVGSTAAKMSGNAATAAAKASTGNQQEQQRQQQPSANAAAAAVAAVAAVAAGAAAGLGYSASGSDSRSSVPNPSAGDDPMSVDSDHDAEPVTGLRNDDGSNVLVSADGYDASDTVEVQTQRVRRPLQRERRVPTKKQKVLKMEAAESALALQMAEDLADHSADVKVVYPSLEPGFPDLPHNQLPKTALERLEFHARKAATQSGALWGPTGGDLRYVEVGVQKLAEKAERDIRDAERAVAWTAKILEWAKDLREHVEPYISSLWGGNDQPGREEQLAARQAIAGLLAAYAKALGRAAATKHDSSQQPEGLLPLRTSPRPPDVRTAPVSVWEERARRNALQQQDYYLQSGALLANFVQECSAEKLTAIMSAPPLANPAPVREVSLVAVAVVARLVALGEPLRAFCAAWRGLRDAAYFPSETVKEGKLLREAFARLSEPVDILVSTDQPDTPLASLTQLSMFSAATDVASLFYRRDAKLRELGGPEVRLFVTALNNPAMDEREGEDGGTQKQVLRVLATIAFCQYCRPLTDTTVPKEFLFGEFEDQVTEKRMAQLAARHGPRVGIIGEPVEALELVQKQVTEQRRNNEQPSDLLALVLSTMCLSKPWNDGGLVLLKRISRTSFVYKMGFIYDMLGHCWTDLLGEFMTLRGKRNRRKVLAQLQAILRVAEADTWVRELLLTNHGLFKVLLQHSCNWPHVFGPAGYLFAPDLRRDNVIRNSLQRMLPPLKLYFERVDLVLASELKEDIANIAGKKLNGFRRVFARLELLRSHYEDADMKWEFMCLLKGIAELRQRHIKLESELQGFARLSMRDWKDYEDLLTRRLQVTGYLTPSPVCPRSPADRDEDCAQLLQSLRWGVPGASERFVPAELPSYRSIPSKKFCGFGSPPPSVVEIYPNFNFDAWLKRGKALLLEERQRQLEERQRQTRRAKEERVSDAGSSAAAASANSNDDANMRPAVDDSAPGNGVVAAVTSASDTQDTSVAAAAGREQTPAVQANASHAAIDLAGAGGASAQSPMCDAELIAMAIANVAKGAKGPSTNETRKKARERKLLAAASRKRPNATSGACSGPAGKKPRTKPAATVSTGENAASPATSAHAAAAAAAAPAAAAPTAAAPSAGANGTAAAGAAAADAAAASGSNGVHNVPAASEAQHSGAMADAGVGLSAAAAAAATAAAGAARHARFGETAASLSRAPYALVNNHPPASTIGSDAHCGAGGSSGVQAASRQVAMAPSGAAAAAAAAARAAQTLRPAAASHLPPAVGAAAAQAQRMQFLDSRRTAAGNGSSSGGGGSSSAVGAGACGSASVSYGGPQGLPLPPPPQAQGQGTRPMVRFDPLTGAIEHVDVSVACLATLTPVGQFGPNTGAAAAVPAARGDFTAYAAPQSSARSPPVPLLRQDLPLPPGVRDTAQSFNTMVQRQAPTADKLPGPLQPRAALSSPPPPPFLPPLVAAHRGVGILPNPFASAPAGGAGASGRDVNTLLPAANVAHVRNDGNSDTLRWQDNSSEAPDSNAATAPVAAAAGAAAPNRVSVLHFLQRLMPSLSGSRVLPPPAAPFNSTVSQETRQEPLQRSTSIDDDAGLFNVRKAGSKKRPAPSQPLQPRLELSTCLAATEACDNSRSGDKTGVVDAQTGGGGGRSSTSSSSGSASVAFRPILIPGRAAAGSVGDGGTGRSLVEQLQHLRAARAAARAEEAAAAAAGAANAFQPSCLASDDPAASAPAAAGQSSGVLMRRLPERLDGALMQSSGVPAAAPLPGTVDLGLDDENNDEGDWTAFDTGEPVPLARSPKRRRVSDGCGRNNDDANPAANEASRAVVASPALAASLTEERAGNRLSCDSGWRKTAVAPSRASSVQIAEPSVRNCVSGGESISADSLAARPTSAHPELQSPSTMGGELVTCATPRPSERSSGAGNTAEAARTRPASSASTLRVSFSSQRRRGLAIRVSSAGALAAQAAASALPAAGSSGGSGANCSALPQRARMEVTNCSSRAARVSGLAAASGSSGRKPPTRFGMDLLARAAALASEQDGQRASGGQGGRAASGVGGSGASSLKSSDADGTGASGSRGRGMAQFRASQQQQQQQQYSGGIRRMTAPEIK